MPSPNPRRAVVDRHGVALFVHLARIAAAAAPLSAEEDAQVRGDLQLLREEAERAHPRHAVALALADLVLAGLDRTAPIGSLVTLTEARDALERPRPDLHLVAKDEATDVLRDAGDEDDGEDDGGDGVSYVG